MKSEKSNNVHNGKFVLYAKLHCITTANETSKFRVEKSLEIHY